MASTYSTNLAIELIGTGDQAGTWGVTTNTNLGTLIEQAISGYVTQAVSTGADTTITIPNGATGVARNMYIELTGTGGTNTNLIVPSNKKLYFIFNNTASGQVTVKVSGQTGVSVPNGKKMVLVCNGTDVVNGINYIADFGTNSFTVTNLTASSGTITNLIATTGTITTLSATSGNISNLVSSDASATVLRAGSATLTHLSATSASITNLALTSLTISSLSITNVSVASATVSSNLTLSGGTANGVLYLNGSKVATSGSALTFNGTTLTAVANAVVGDGTAATRRTLVVNGGANAGIGAYLGVQIGGSLVGTLASSGWAAGDTSTDLAVYADTGKSIRFYSAGAESMRLTSTGLGIGTTSPTANLDIVGTSAVEQFRIGNTAGGTDFGITVTENATTIINSAEGATGRGIQFQSGGTNTVLFGSGGDVGIGTSSPASQLDVSKTGDAVLSLTSSGVQRYQLIARSSGKFEIYDQTAAASRVTMTEAGNLGLGVTPSAWRSLINAFQVGGTGAAIYAYTSGTGQQDFNISNNSFENSSGNDIYIRTNPAAKYQQFNNQHRWYNAASGTAGNTISFTQAMTLTAAGELCVGTTAAAISNAMLTVYNPAATSAHIFLQNTTTGTGNNGARLLMQGNDLYVTNKENAPMIFETNDTERARITSDGNFYVNTTGAGGKFYVVSDLTANNGLRVDVPASFTATAIALVSATAAGAGWYFLTGESSGGSARIQIRGDGNVYNANGTYGTISDARLKQDIVDAPSQWGDIKAIRFRKYRMKADVEADSNAPELLGVVAQELEAVCPGLVDENTNKNGEITKTVKSSILLMKAAVALQEAMARIEQLEAKVAALESK